MFRSTTLSSSHYAGKWAIPDESQRNDLAVTNQLGYDYGIAADGPEEEAHLHKLLECFHGYLSKYLVMIIRGTIPEPNSRAGKDAKEFLRMLRPADAPKGSDLSNATCKMLHLAFKQQTTEEIYDTLAYCFMRAARRYDPRHTDKVRDVCKEIDGKTEFTAQQLEVGVGHDCTRILRALVRKGFLSSVIGKKRKVIAYRPAAWPPPAGFLQSGPMGFVYVLQMWFRYYLTEHSVAQMGCSTNRSAGSSFSPGPSFTRWGRQSSMARPHPTRRDSIHIYVGALLAGALVRFGRKMEDLQKQLAQLDQLLAFLEEQRIRLVNEITAGHGVIVEQDDANHSLGAYSPWGQSTKAQISRVLQMSPKRQS